MNYSAINKTDLHFWFTERMRISKLDNLYRVVQRDVQAQYFLSDFLRLGPTIIMHILKIILFIRIQDAPK